MPTKIKGDVVVKRCNELAGLFYRQRGYRTEKGFRFDQATHPEERGMWHQAAMAYEFLTGIDPNVYVDEDE